MRTQSFSYDPDAETEYSNQMTNSLECLYEFKESAEFIAFTDWDDVLLSPRLGFFGKTFHDISNRHPLAASFAVARLDASLPKPFSKTNKFNFETAVKDVVYGETLPDPKIVVRPERVAGIWIHKLILAERSYFYETKINKESAIILHIRNLTYNGDTGENKIRNVVGNLTEFLEGNIMEQNLESFFKRHNFEFVSFFNLKKIFS